MFLGDGEGFVRCACGHRHWGLYGAAGLLLSDPDRGVLLQRRAWWTHHGGTWALPGGAIRAGESAAQAATREAQEEAAIDPDAVRVSAASTEEHVTWRYTTVLASVNGDVRPKAVSRETAALRWVSPDEVPDLPLHRDFAAAWPRLRGQLERRLVLVVDAANVVGSRPDGWWRDRAGAAARLRDRLGTLVRTDVPGSDIAVPDAPDWSWRPRVLMVVEGRATATGPHEDVEVLAAPADGDSAIVHATRRAREARPRDHVVVVTADRELRARVRSEGADVLGPSTLLQLLDAQVH